MKTVEVIGHGSLPFITSVTSGYAASMGIDIPLRVVASYTDKPGDVEFVIKGEWDRDTKLINQVRKGFIHRYLSKSKGKGIRIEIESRIPPGIGLKSGAAVSVYSVLAAAQLLELTFSENDIIHHALNISKAVGGLYSASLDGIYASLKGGVVYTDNMGGRVISWYTGVPEHSIIIGYRRVEGSNLLSRIREIRRYGELFKKIFDVGQKGGHLKAATLNGILFSILGNLDYETLVETLTEGAVAACVAGTGPSICIFVKEDDLDRFRALLEDRGYKTLVTRPTSKGYTYRVVEE